MDSILVDIGGSNVKYASNKSVEAYKTINYAKVGIKNFEEIVKIIGDDFPHIDRLVISNAGPIQRKVIKYNNYFEELKGKRKDYFEKVFNANKVYIINDGEAHALGAQSILNLKEKSLCFCCGTYVGLGIVEDKSKKRSPKAKNEPIRDDNFEIWNEILYNDLTVEELLTGDPFLFLDDDKKALYIEEYLAFLCILINKISNKIIGTKNIILCGGVISNNFDFWKSKEENIKELASLKKNNINLFIIKEQTSLIGLQTLLK